MTKSNPLDGRSATAHLRPARRARSRFSKAASAAETIKGFGHGMDVVGLTFGQFSLLDLLQAALDITGPADVDIATWSAGLYDIDAAERFVADGRIRSIRFVMDSATQKRGQAAAVDIGRLFGEDRIRTTRSHAKFVLVRNDEWSVVITSSMNLNLNPRIEQFEMTDDAERCAMFCGFVDELFRELPEGATEDRNLPGMFGLESVAPVSGVAVSVGRVRTGVWE
ncbi:MAG: hypothetical protein Q4F65_05830 [Propionibacteriaceae bacterium]|nr:hypothetical protein [Propionibacteriaceae bacterium]